MSDGVVDLAAVKRARDGLADVAEAHPHLTTHEAQERLEAWLEEDQMAREKERLTASLFIRVAPEDIRRIDALAERLANLGASRNAVARAAMRLGVDLLERDPGRIVASPPPPRGRRPSK